MVTISSPEQADRVRSSAVLPYSWDVPTDGEIVVLARKLRSIFNVKASHRSRLEGALLVALTLQTAQPPERLMALPCHLVAALPETRELQEAIYCTRHVSYVVLRRHEFVEEGDEVLANGYYTTVPFIIVPLLQVVHEALRQRLIDLEAPNSSLFTGEVEQVRKAANAILRGGRGWRDRTTKAGRRLRAVGSWLIHRLQTMDGGDPAFALLLGIDRRGLENTLNFYVTLLLSDYLKTYRKALCICPVLAIGTDPECAWDTYIGSRSLPDWAEVEPVIQWLQLQLNKPITLIKGRKGPALGNSRIDADRHLVMMLYTYVLVTFATGQRGLTAPPSLLQIDPETSFAPVTEKGHHTEAEGFRLVWHSPTAKSQLLKYEEYLDTILPILAQDDPQVHAQVVKLRGEKRLALFIVEEGVVCALSPSDLCEAASSFGWKWPRNAGRSWFRSVLAGLASPDVLAAQMGHVHGGMNPWVGDSALDPTMISVELEQAIETQLQLAGLHALPSGPRRRAPYRSDWSPERHNSGAGDIRDGRAKLGALLASAIWNGALLNDALWDEALVKLAEIAGTSGIEPHWIDMCRWSTLGQTRWFLDEGTCRMLRLARRFSVTTAEELDSQIALNAWFGSQAAATDFLARARLKWRARLPPIMFQIANGDVEVHSLANVQRKKVEILAREQRYGPIPEYLLEPFLKYFGWKELKVRGAYDLPRYQRQLRAKRAADCAREGIISDPAWSHLPPLAQDILDAGIEMFTAKREGKGPHRLSAMTIESKLRSVSNYLLSEWMREQQGVTRLADLDAAMLRSSLNAAESGTVNACRDILHAAYLRENDPKIIALREIAKAWRQPYTQMVVKPHAYEVLLSAAVERDSSILSLPLPLYTLLVLLYRLGIRSDELWRVFAVTKGDRSWASRELLLDHEPDDRLKTYESRRRIPIDLLVPEREQSRLVRVFGRRGAGATRAERLKLDNDLGHAIRNLGVCDVWSPWPFRHAFATNLLSTLLWPDDAPSALSAGIDPSTFARRQELRRGLLPRNGMGMHTLHAVAMVMGHTTPERTRFSYAHEQEAVLAAIVSRKSNQDCFWMPASWPI